MSGDLVARIVGLSCRFARQVVLATLFVAIAAGYYAQSHFAMNSRTESLISPNTTWRKREAFFDREFPRQNGLVAIVVDGATPERAEEAAASLARALAANKQLFPAVRRPDDGDFFQHDGLLLLPTAQVKATTEQLIAAQPFLGALAIDPSLRGVADSLSTALLGVSHGQAKLSDLDTPMVAFSRTLASIFAGNQAFLSWRSLVTGRPPALRETRRFIEVTPRLDFGALEPGRRATDAIRAVIARLNLNPGTGVTVRLTGPVPMQDDQFGSLTDRARLMATVMMTAVLAMLWFAVRSVRLIFSILLAVFSGLTITTAAGLLVVGAFNLISVAFIALFVGLGVDFGIQFCVRYRAERYETGDLDLALRHAGAGVGGALALAAAATAAGFYSFLPTSYRGVAELGFVAGTGMLITFALSITFLPALIRLLSPAGEQEPVGFVGLAPLDRQLRSHKRVVLLGAVVLGIGAAAPLPFLEFDFNPLDLRNPRVESVSTALELMQNPETSPNTLDVLEPSRGAADRTAQRLSALPEVSQVLTLNSFVPDDQSRKLALIADAGSLLDPTINPFLTKPVPTDAEVVQSLNSAAKDLASAAGNGTDKAARDARRLAEDFRRLAAAGRAARARAELAFIPGLNTMLDQLRASLTPFPVTAKTLPRDLVRDWVSSGGLYRVEVHPKSEYNSGRSLHGFTKAVQKVAPGAVGEPLVIQESGRTIVRAFIQAGILSFLAITVLLFIALRSAVLVGLALGPLVLAGIVTLATCFVIGLPLNYANIIALPLLFGIGVAFDIYFVMAWRAGLRDLLGSSLTRAVILSAGTTASAFGTLWISNDPGTASMGELLVISLAWILVAVLFLLPALMAYAVPWIGLREPTASQRMPYSAGPRVSTP